MVNAGLCRLGRTRTVLSGIMSQASQIDARPEALTTLGKKTNTALNGTHSRSGRTALPLRWPSWNGGISGEQDYYT